MFDKHEFDGREIDLIATFQPQWSGVKVVKLVLFLWALSVMIQDLATFVPNYGTFWLAWLTIWMMIVAVVYLLCSLSLTVPAFYNKEVPSWFINLTWALAGIAAVGQLLVTILYWTLDHVPSDNSVTYNNIMAHGGLTVLVWIDTLYINHVPVRFRQLLLGTGISVLYIIWSGVHAALDVGNPSNSDPSDEEDDDALYSVLSWNRRPAQAAIISTLVVFLDIPILFFFFWATTAYGGGCRFDGSYRRFKETDKTEPQP